MLSISKDLEKSTSSFSSTVICCWYYKEFLFFFFNRPVNIGKGLRISLNQRYTSQRSSHCVMKCLCAWVTGLFVILRADSAEIIFDILVPDVCGFWHQRQSDPCSKRG